MFRVFEVKLSTWDNENDLAKLKLGLVRIDVSTDLTIPKIGSFGLIQIYDDKFEINYDL